MAEKTFGERADDYANSIDDQPWFEARHARLSELLTAYWLGEFEDEHGNSRLTLSLDSYGSSPHPCSRDFMFRILPTGSAGMPKEIRYHDPRARPYHAFAAMQARQYPPGCFDVERIEINDDDYQKFLRNHHKAVINQGQKKAQASPPNDTQAQEPLTLRAPRKRPAKLMHERWVARAKELKELNPDILTSAIASKIRTEDQRFNEQIMKSNDPDKTSDQIRKIKDTGTIRRILTARQKEWNLPPES